ncbi:MAG: hypothetical protein ACOC43_15875 [Desulfohalobiaceae bacterium]
MHRNTINLAKIWSAHFMQAFRLNRHGRLNCASRLIRSHPVQQEISAIIGTKRKP